MSGVPHPIREFLIHRWADDVALALKCASMYPTPWDVNDRGYSATVRADAPGFRIIVDADQDLLPDGKDPGWLSERLDYFARWSPDMVISDITIKRRILDEHWQTREEWASDPSGYVAACGRCSYSDGVAYPAPCMTLRFLASAYANHPDYSTDWSPA